MPNHKLHNLLPIIRDYFSRQPVLRAWLFGSYSRSGETSDSDIDILVDFDNSQGLVSLFTMGGILMDLSDLLGKRVDLVDNKGLMDFARKVVVQIKSTDISLRSLRDISVVLSSYRPLPPRSLFIN